jgi:C4-dicarboxylate transporter DctM subunit
VAFLTPPFGVNLFVSSGITGKGIVEVARSAIPYLILLYAVLMVVTYVPWISLVLTRFVE